MKTGKRIVRILIGVLSVAALLALALNVGVTVMYSGFFQNAEAIFRAPGLTTGFVPQGFAYLPEQEVYLVSGYMKDHSAARIYIRNANGDSIVTSLLRADGSGYDEHAGGVAVNGDYVYLPGTGGLDVFLLSDVLDGGQAASIGSIPMDYSGDCCTFYNGYLFVGDFYYPEVYETPEDHRFTTPAGDHNPAVIAVYRADDSAEFGLAWTPVAAISIREKVQGIGFAEDGQIVLSTSYGFAHSNLWFYEFDETRQNVLTLQDAQVPLYFLDSANLTHSVQMPPMSEEIVCRDGQVYVLFESASTKYLFGNLIRGTHIYGYRKP